MRLIRLYIDEPLNEGSKILVKNDSFHYLAKVLKAKKNQKIILFNNTGFDFHGHIKNVTDRYFEINLDKRFFLEKNIYTTEIAFSICKNPCSDFIIKKLTELGISSFQPLISKFSIFNKKKIDLEKKLKHWKNISISSSEQSERSYLPIIKNTISFQDYIDSCSSVSKIILNTKSQNMINNVYNSRTESCSVLVGPEGDFSDEEYSYAKQSDFSSVSLGDNILRVETAAIAAISYIKIINSNENK